MIRSIRQFARLIRNALAKLEFEDLIPHRLKRLSRRFLGVGFAMAALVHIIVAGTVYWYRFLEPTFEDMIELTPYPPFLVEVIIENTLVSDAEDGESAEDAEAAGDPGEDAMGSAGDDGGGTEGVGPAGDSGEDAMGSAGDDGGGMERAEAVGDPGDDIMGAGESVSVVAETPPPVEENELAEAHEIAAIEAPPPVEESAILEGMNHDAEMPEPFDEIAISEPHEITSFEVPPPVKLAISEVHEVTTFDLPRGDD